MKRLLVILVLTATVILGGTTWLDHVRASTTRPTPNGLHALATTAPSGVFSPYPKRHAVKLDPVGDNALELGLAYARRILDGGGLVEEGGRYEMPTGTIRLVSEQVRFESSLPSGLRPDFDRTIRHEYGHAFLYDLLTDKVGLKSKRGATLVRETLSASPTVNAPWPSGLKGVVLEYRKVSRLVYADPYYTSTLTEYLAESYARFGSGQSVPPATRAFLASFVH